jgi:preprotein translocase subunit SecG
MITVILVIHLLIATALVGVILIQRSEGGALSGLGGGTMGGLMTARGTANLLTRTTAILAACFIGTSLVLAILASRSGGGGSILDTTPTATPPAATAPAAPAGEPAPAPAPGAPAPGQGTEPPPASPPAEPAAPIAR